MLEIVEEGVHRAEKAFDAWASMKYGQGELSVESIGKYKPLWMTWLSWCSAKGLAWDQIQSTDIRLFLSGPAQGKGVSRRKAINPQRMSSHTSQRYFRLMFGVYTNASKQGLIANNPAMDLDEAERPSIAATDRQSQVLEPFVFEKLVMLSSIEEIFPRKSEGEWLYARDRAILAVLIETGITVGELIALRGIDLVDSVEGRAVASPYFQPSLLSPKANIQSHPMRLDVMETEKIVGRSLNISSELVPLIRAWVVWRERLLSDRSLLMPQTSHDDFMRLHAFEGPLFFARSASDASPHMDAASVYRVASKGLLRIREIANLTALSYVAKGPGIIRNTVIRRWIDELGPSEAAARAGLKNETSLRLRTG